MLYHVQVERYFACVAEKSQRSVVYVSCVQWVKLVAHAQSVLLVCCAHQDGGIHNEVVCAGR